MSVMTDFLLPTNTQVKCYCPIYLVSQQFFFCILQLAVGVLLRLQREDVSQPALFINWYILIRTIKIFSWKTRFQGHINNTGRDTVLRRKVQVQNMLGYSKWCGLKKKKTCYIFKLWLCANLSVCQYVCMCVCTTYPERLVMVPRVMGCLIWASGSTTVRLGRGVSLGFPMLLLVKLLYESWLLSLAANTRHKIAL